MVTSPSRSDPTSAASVSSAQFNTTRRGFDQNEVRDFLRMVAAELARLQERERFLERELKTAQSSSRNTPTAAFDDETATRLLGEEAAHILQAAREASNQIRARSEEGSARLLREATEESHRFREEAEIESARRRQDAAADAEAELTMAKQQGRDMVNEARAYRERVLSELARRREAATQQIEQLGHGRDRLLQVFERARQASVEVMAELTPLGEPDPLVNLAPITGPVPIVPSMRPATAKPPAHDDTVRSLPTPVEQIHSQADDDREPAQVVSLFAEEAAVAEGEANVDVVEESNSGQSTEAPTVEIARIDDLFDRLRSSRAADIAQLVTDADPGVAIEDVAEMPSVNDNDEQVIPLIVAAARKLKRVLADEQNDVLDTLRRQDPVLTLDALLPAESDQAARYIDAVRAELVSAGVAGAGGAKQGGDAAIVRPACDAITNEIVAPLRERLARCIDKADGNNSDLATQARSVYREWKINRIDEHLDEVVRLAFARGALTLASR